MRRMNDVGLMPVIKIKMVMVHGPWDWVTKDDSFPSVSVVATSGHTSTHPTSDTVGLYGCAVPVVGCRSGSQPARLLQ